MVLTAAQTTAFFENADQMGIPHATVVQLGIEGIVTIGDLADFHKDALQHLADNLRKPGGWIADPNPAAAARATIPTPAFVFGAKSQKRLGVACDLVGYYDTVGHDLMAPNMHWNQVGKNFEIQWKALKDRKEEDSLEVLKITKTLPIMKWTEAFQDYLHRMISVRVIPLAYIICTNSDVPMPVPLLAPNQPHSKAHGSIEYELEERASHEHPLFRDDNSEVYFKLEEATHGTTYMALTKPFQRAKNGRGAYAALTSQHAGREKWESEIHQQDDLLHNWLWKGQSNFPLEGFVAQHPNAFVSMQQCAEHVSFQLPNEHTRVGYLLEGIQSMDPGLQVAMASVKMDDGMNGMRNDFEAAAAHLLPYDPVAKKNAAMNRPVAQISSVEEVAKVSGTAAMKESIGKTGVHLRWHTNAEYKELTSEQKR